MNGGMGRGEVSLASAVWIRGPSWSTKPGQTHGAHHPSEVGEEEHQNVPGDEREEDMQTLGSTKGCAELPLVGSVGKETKITASEQEVGELLENLVKYKRCHFAEQN